MIIIGFKLIPLGQMYLLGKDDVNIKMKCIQPAFKHMRCLYEGEQVKKFTDPLTFM